MGDDQDKACCSKPDITVFETCHRCGNLVSFENLRQQAVKTYERDNQPIEDANLPRRHPRMKDSRNCLRLLDLDEGTFPVLSGRFKCTEIQHVPPYEAVSYTWGGEDGDYSKPKFIIIGGKLFPITKNCDAALRKIRKQDEAKVIWIDALCINQNDVKERSAQVSQMNKIFSGAQKVHIYLGNNIDDTTASKALDVLRPMGNLDDFSAALADVDTAVAVKRLFTQAYFSRMWIIQEVLLAKAAELHWGNGSAPWQALSDKHLDLIEGRYGSCFPDWMRIRAGTKNFRNPEALGELLFSAMASSAKNDRDKVYGIYGLLFDPEEEGLTVDYSLSVREVFTNMAAHLVTKNNALEAVLQHVNCEAPPVDGERLPSWVPDFRSAPSTSIFSVPRRRLEIRSSVQSHEVVFSCGADGLRLRGHRLRIFQNEHQHGPGNAFTFGWEVEGEHFESHPSLFRFVAVGMADDVDFRAWFDVGFDPEYDIIFCTPNGLTLHLKRHPTRGDAWTFSGGCHLSVLGNFSDIVVRNRRTSFADAMFSLSLEDLEDLWKFCTDLRSILQGRPVQVGSAVFIPPDTRMGRENADDAFNAYRDLYTGGTLDILGPKGTLEPDLQTMVDFQDFWEKEDTWKTLHTLYTAVHRPEGYDTQNIELLCQSWLLDYEKAEDLLNLLKQSIASNVEDVAPTFLEHLEAWKSTTGKLFKALHWTHEHSWPFKSFPGVWHRLWDGNWDWDWNWHWNEDSGAEDSPRGEEGRFDLLIKKNFERVLHKFNAFADTYRSLAWEFARQMDVLEPWGGEWSETIRLIPRFLTIRDQFSLEDLLRLKNLFQLVDLFQLQECSVQRGALRQEDIEIGQAETVTIL
ncbi:hypothetical protein ACHAPT_006237 [Fusarium lateritium]